MRRVLLLCSLLPAAVGLAACGGDDSTPATALSLGPGASGTTVAVSPKQAVKITLPANASTGYHWVVVAAPNPAVMETGPAAYGSGAAAAGASSTTPAIVGAPGEQTYAFTGKATGTTTFAAAYMSPGRRSTAGRHFTVTFKVG